MTARAAAKITERNTITSLVYCNASTVEVSDGSACFEKRLSFHPSGGHFIAQASEFLDSFFQMMRLLGGDHSVSERQAHLSIDRICRSPGQNGSIKADLVAHRQRRGDAKVQ
ncbi:MAG: hypothetical protein WCC41_19245 [Rhodomicrobium sp.]